MESSIYHHPHPSALQSSPDQNHQPSRPEHVTSASSGNPQWFYLSSAKIKPAMQFTETYDLYVCNTKIDTDLVVPSRKKKTKM